MYKLLFATSVYAQYSSSLKCGKCINGGYNFCFQGNDTQQFDSDSQITATCCQDETCAEMTNAAYTCSKSYSDTDYAMTFCPQPKNKCGQQSEINFVNNMNVTNDLNIASMDEGDVCTYKIKSQGGSPGFQLKNSTSTDCNKMEIKYVEYNEYNINTTDTSGPGSNPSNRKQKKPALDKPGRNASMANAGKPADGTMGQQKAPARRFTNGTKTTEETTDQRKQKKFNFYSQNKQSFEKENNDGATKNNRTQLENNRKPRWFKSAFPLDFDKEFVVGRGGSSKQQRKGTSKDEESKADMGYGAMTKGEYNACGGKGTFKTFGSTGQGWSKLGVKDDNAGEDEPRTMLITVRAKQSIAAPTSSSGVVGSSGSAIQMEASVSEFTDTNAYSSAGLNSNAFKTTLGLAAAFVTFAASF